MKTNSWLFFGCLLLGIGCQTSSPITKPAQELVVIESENQSRGIAIPPKEEPAKRDGKIILTPSTNKSFLMPEPDCAAEVFSVASATTTHRYANEKLGFNLELPWNPNWGNEKFTIEPFDERTISEDTTMVEFGPIKAYWGPGGCSWSRIYSLFINPPSDFNSEVDRIIKNEPDEIEAAFGKLDLKRFKVGAFQALSYREIIPADAIHTIEIFTPKATLRFLVSKTGNYPDILNTTAKSLRFE